MPQRGSNDSSGDSKRDREGADGKLPAAQDGIPIGRPSDADTLTAMFVALDCVQEARLSAILDEAGIRHATVAGPTEAIAQLVASRTDFVFISGSTRQNEVAPIAAQARRISAGTKVIVAGNPPHADMMRAIELYGTEVAPAVRKEIARLDAAAPVGAR